LYASWSSFTFKPVQPNLGGENKTGPMATQDDAGASFKLPSSPSPPSLTLSSSSSSEFSSARCDSDNHGHVGISSDSVPPSKPGLPDHRKLLANTPGLAPDAPSDDPFNPVAVAAPAQALPSPSPSQAITPSPGTSHGATATAAPVVTPAATATADDLINLLRDFRDHINRDPLNILHNGLCNDSRRSLGEFDDPDCRIVERRLPWAELGLVVRRLGLDTWLIPSSPDEGSWNNGNSGAGESPGHDDPRKRDLDLGAFINARCNWEYTADEKFRILMGQLQLHHVLARHLTELIHQRIAIAADKLRAASDNGLQRNWEDADLPDLYAVLSPPVDLHDVPLSPGSDESRRAEKSPDGAIRQDDDVPPRLAVEIGFSHPISDKDAKAYIRHGGINTVVVVNIPHMTRAQRLQASDPAHVPVTVKIFRLVKTKVGARHDNTSNSSTTSITTTATSSATTPTETVYFCAKLATNHEDVPLTAPSDRANAQLGLCLQDVYPKLPYGLSAEAQVDVSFRDVWGCVRPAWESQRKRDLAMEIEDREKKEGKRGRKPVRLREKGGERGILLSSSPTNSADEGEEEEGAPLPKRQKLPRKASTKTSKGG
jgi:hypothetical protein